MARLSLLDDDDDTDPIKVRILKLKSKTSKTTFYNDLPQQNLKNIFYKKFSNCLKEAK